MADGGETGAGGNLILEIKVISGQVVSGHFWIVVTLTLCDLVVTLGTQFRLCRGGFFSISNYHLREISVE